MKSGVKSNWNRRQFMQSSSLFLLGLAFFNSCKKKGNDLFLKLTGTNHILGHRLRFPNFPTVTETIKIPYLIIGGGITGLSAARSFHQKGITDFLLIELEDKIGGNSIGGENTYSKYPLGAHYLPIPNASNTALLKFLEEENIIKGFNEANEPIFDEDQLSFAPQERLFIKNFWQEGLVPTYGLSPEELNEIDRFFELMKNFQVIKGEDNLFVFDLPMQLASGHHSYKYLDNLTMEDWLKQENFSTQPLLEYINYCCRDDYGTGIKQTSAFAGIHYFAARKHDFKAYQNLVLTWQEGNQRLVNHLAKYVENKHLNQHLVYQIIPKNDFVEVLVYDEKRDVSKKIIAEKVISCAPQFINQYFFPTRKEFTKQFNYAPWLIATITLNKLPFADGAPLSWDNVIYQGKGLGYVFAQHQSVGQYKSPFVLSYFHSLEGEDLGILRKKMYKMTDDDWKDFILEDLSKAHFNIKDEIVSIEIYRRGHGMISPRKGFLFSDEKEQLKKNINDQIYFAHSDLSGISVFEEAFYQGISVVDEVLKK